MRLLCCLPATSAVQCSMCHGHCCHRAFLADATPPLQFWSQLPSPPSLSSPATVVVIHLTALSKSGYFSDHNRQQRNCLYCLFLPTVEHHFCMRGQWWSHWVRSCCSWRCKVSFSCSHGRGLPHLLRASGHSGPVCKLHTHLCIEQKWTTKPEYLHLHLQEICFLHVSSTVVSPTSLSLGIMMY